MEIVYFIGAFILLSALVYGSTHWHCRDRRNRDRNLRAQSVAVDRRAIR